MKRRVSLVAVIACLWSASAVGQDQADHSEVASQIKLMNAWIQVQMKDIDLVSSSASCTTRRSFSPRHTATLTSSATRGSCGSTTSDGQLIFA